MNKKLVAAQLFSIQRYLSSNPQWQIPLAQIYCKDE
jgi:hypothetical protein